MAAKIRRKQYFISLRFQLKYIAYILLFLYIGAAIAGYTVYYTTWVMLGEKLANVYPRGRLIYIFHDANVALILRLFFITPLFILIGTLLSHRIAGPVYRIGKYAESTMQGDLSEDLYLRKNDELKDLAGKMTELCRDLRDKKEKRGKTVSEVAGFLETNRVDQKVINGVKEKLGTFI